MTVLIAWLWQGLLVVAAIELLLRAAPRVNATTRHAIWWVALLGVVSIPIALYASDALPHLGSEPATIAQSGSAASRGVLVELPLLPDWVGALLLGVWGGTVLVGSARLWNGVAAMRRLESGSYPMPEARQARLACWTTWRGRGRRVELRLSNDHAGAAALGFGSPVILVGAALAEVLDDQELDAIVMHEYAHLARRDDWSRLCQALIESVARLHPAIALIARRIDVEREAACDDWVVNHAMGGRQYAACLTELATLVRSAAPSHAYAIVPGATGSRGSLYTRVERLLDGGRDRSRRLGRAPFTAAAVAAGSVLLLTVTADPLVGFTDGAADEPIVTSTAAAAPVGSNAGWTAAQDAPVVPTAEAPAVSSPPTSTRIADDRIESSTPRPHVLPPTADRAVGADAPSLQQPPLTAHPFSQAPHTAPAVVAAAIGGQPDESSEQDGAWERLAAAGTQAGTGAARGGSAIGRGTKKAGLSVAGFFTRAGKGIAGSF